MSGHSKWATIKHKKGARPTRPAGKLFAKLIRQVEVAAREGGGDLDANADPAHDVPEGPRRLGAARHDRAGHQAGHRRARGRHLRADHLRGLRPGRRRRARRGAHRQPQPHRRRGRATSSPSNGGSLAEPGAVAWQFERKGVVIVATARSTRTTSCSPRSTPAPRTSSTRATPGGSPRAPTDLHAVRDRARGRRASPSTSADLTMLPTTTVAARRRRARPRRCCG